MGAMETEELSNRLCEQAVLAHRAYEKHLNVPDETSYTIRQFLNGQISGLRIALCLLHGWDPLHESGKEEKADDLIIEWWQTRYPDEWT